MKFIRFPSHRARRYGLSYALGPNGDKAQAWYYEDLRKSGKGIYSLTDAQFDRMISFNSPRVIFTIARNPELLRKCYR